MIVDRAEDAPGRAKRIRAIVGFVIGSLLLAAAVWVAYSQERALSQGLASLRSARWWLVALALFLPIANLLVVSVGFWLLNNLRGRVALAEMTALIFSAWLLNFLPLRPGMFGRIAYHKKYNAIGIKDSARVLIETLFLSGCSMLLLACIGLTLAGFDVASTLAWALALALPLALTLAAWALAPARHTRAYAGAAAMKYTDMLIWTARYWVVFQLIGTPLGVREAVAVAFVSQIALLIPLVGNGLGLREWAIGLLAASLPAWFDRDGLGSAGIGLTADLVNRAAELLVAVPTGILGTLLVARFARSHTNAPERATGRDLSDHPKPPPPGTTT